MTTDKPKNTAPEQAPQGFLQKMLDAVSHPFYLVDASNYQVLLANEASGFPADYKGTPCYKLTHNSDHPCSGSDHPCSIEECKRTKGPVVMEHVHTDARGGEIIVEIHAYPLLDEQGEVSQVIEYCLDISDKRGLERQLRQAQKMESIATMAGGIAHDFNNILTVILGFSDLARSILPPEHEAVPYLEEVLKASRRARDLVAQILAFSRQGETCPQAIFLTPIVKESIKLLRATLPANIKLEANISPDCGKVLADPGQFHQVLMNICTNAFQAMEDSGGILSISQKVVKIKPVELEKMNALSPGTYVCLQVSDTGIGMNPLTVERIFEPYFTTKGQGSGLGLSVAYGIIKHFGGDIKVKSEQGLGSTFRIYLPEMLDDPEVIDDELLPKGNEHLIIVDDEATIINLAQRMLEKLGYKVTAFTESQQALEAVLARPAEFDLLLSDYMMPGLSGLALARQITEAGIRLPVIIFSGYRLPKESMQGTEKLGVRDILKKPFDMRVLSASIRNALGTS